jgi:hypothetical protein
MTRNLMIICINSVGKITMPVDVLYMENICFSIDHQKIERTLATYTIVVSIYDDSIVCRGEQTAISVRCPAVYQNDGGPVDW